jgi:hypothetical protein
VQGVFETIRVWASQGWVLQSVFFCELPLGDHVSVFFAFFLASCRLVIM